MMKKSGFTIAEIMIALALVAVVALVTIPLMKNIMPDKDKLMVLKAYKMINDTTAELLANPNYYQKRQCVGEEKQCVGLADLTQVSAGACAGVGGANKYFWLLGEGLKQGFCDSYNGQNTVTVLEVDGIQWSVSQLGGPYQIYGADVGDSPDGCDYIVSIDRNGDEDPNRTFDATVSINNPDFDQFSFRVRYDGFITGNDSLTKQYLKTADKLNNKKDDYKAARGINASNNLE